jgi:hypothetical protein
MDSSLIKSTSIASNTGELETFDLQTDEDILRFSTFKNLFDRCAHSMLPVVSGYRVSHETQSINAYIAVENGSVYMTPENADTVTIPSIITVLESLCSLLVIMDLMKVQHGNIHESNLSYNHMTGRCILRGFVSSAADIPSAGTDIRKFITMAKRLANTHGIPLVLSQCRAGCELRMMTAAIERLRQIQTVNSNTIFSQMRALLPHYMMSVGDTQIFDIDASSPDSLINGVVFATNHAISQAPSLLVPYFKYSNSDAIGHGPSCQIINQFFNILLAKQLIQYHSNSTNARGYAWPALPNSTPNERYLTKMLYAVMGNLIIYARMMNFHLEVEFSPVLVHLLIADKEEVKNVGAMSTLDKEIAIPRFPCISVMNTGAKLYAALLKHVKMPIETLCNTAHATTAASILPRIIQFNSQTVSDDQKCVFIAWLVSLSEAEASNFLIMLTGTPKASKDSSKIYISVSDSPMEYSISACSHSMVVPAYVLTSVQTCAEFFRQDVSSAGTSHAFNAI